MTLWQKQTLFKELAMNLEKVASELAKKAVASRNFGGVVKAGEYAEWAAEYEQLAQEHYNELKTEKKAGASDILKALSEGYSSLDPTSRSALAGAGLGVGAGALSGLAGNLFSGNKKKHYLSDMLGYGLLGGGLGAGSGALYSLATGNDALGDLKNLIGYSSNAAKSTGVDAGKTLGTAAANAGIKAPSSPGAAGQGGSPAAAAAAPAAVNGIPGTTDAGDVMFNPEEAPEILKQLNDFNRASGAYAATGDDISNYGLNFLKDVGGGGVAGAVAGGGLAKGVSSLSGPGDPTFKGEAGRTALNDFLKTKLKDSISAGVVRNEPKALLDMYTTHLGNLSESVSDPAVRRKLIADDLGIILDDKGLFKGVTGDSVLNRMASEVPAYRNSLARELLAQPDAAHLQEKFREVTKPVLGFHDVLGFNGRDYGSGALPKPEIHPLEVSEAKARHLEETRGLRGVGVHAPVRGGLAGIVLGAGYGVYDGLKNFLSKPEHTPKENGIALTTAVDQLLRMKDLSSEQRQALESTKATYGGGLSKQDLEILLGKMQQAIPAK